jgi:leucyl/phenylalanyl-tRNA---protein transferase
MTIPWLFERDPFPPVDTALRDPNGLLAAGGGLSTERLLDAYARGIFPWFGDDDPELWWSPDPRIVLWLRDLHVSRSLRRTIRSARYTVTIDTAFPQVIAACAEPRDAEGDTWITAGMMDAYNRLAVVGHAHSVEVWSGGELAGGVYGVALGRMFYGESMFSHGRDASKVALVYLVRQLERWGFELIDCQTSTAHLASLGAREIPRAEFLQHVDRLAGLPAVPSPWTLEPDLMESL